MAQNGGFRCDGIFPINWIGRKGILSDFAESSSVNRVTHYPTPTLKIMLNLNRMFGIWFSDPEITPPASSRLPMD